MNVKKCDCCSREMQEDPRSEFGDTVVRPTLPKKHPLRGIRISLGWTIPLPKASQTNLRDVCRYCLLEALEHARKRQD